MTLSKVPFSDFLRYDYLDHFDTFKNDTFESDTFEHVWVDRHPHKYMERAREGTGTRGLNGAWFLCFSKLEGFPFKNPHRLRVPGPPNILCMQITLYFV